MRRLKVVVILDYYPHIGGGDLSIFKFAQALRDLGHEVFLFAKTRDAFVAEMPFRWTPAFPLRVKGSLRVNAFLDQFWHVPRMVSFLKGKGVDWVLGYQKTSAIKAVKVAKAIGARSGLFVFESPVFHGKEPHGEWVKVFSSPRLAKVWDGFKQALLSADVIFPNSGLTKRDAEIWLGRSVERVIYPGIDDHPLPRCEEAHQVCYVGRLYKAKNVDDALRAVARLDDPPRFVIMGDGPERSALESLARELGVDAEFHGVVADEEKWPVISSSKCLLFPTSFEGFGMPPGEALMVGKPAICTDIPILREVYGDHVVYFPEHDVGAFRDGIARLLSDDALRARIGERGRSFIRRTYSWRSSAESISEVLLR